jgi:hypothetical protein
MYAYTLSAHSASGHFGGGLCDNRQPGIFLFETCVDHLTGFLIAIADCSVEL